MSKATSKTADKKADKNTKERTVTNASEVTYSFKGFTIRPGETAILPKYILDNEKVAARVQAMIDSGTFKWA